MFKMMIFRFSYGNKNKNGFELLKWMKKIFKLTKELEKELHRHFPNKYRQNATIRPLQVSAPSEILFG